MNASAAVETALAQYGRPVSIHEAIDLCCRAARALAPAIAESALESGNTDLRPAGGRKADAWDLIALAHALNQIAG